MNVIFIVIAVILCVAVAAVSVVSSFKRKGSNSQNLQATAGDTQSGDTVMIVADVIKAGKKQIVIGSLENYVENGTRFLILDESGDVIDDNVICVGIESCRKLVESADAGQDVGILFNKYVSDLKKGCILMYN